MSRSSKLIGAIIADRYCITGEIGSGGMGKVYRAIPFDDPSQNVAIKVILRNRQLNYEDMLRFQREAALMSRLHHPNIISFHELGLIEAGEVKGLSGGYYIVMEIARGEDLKQVLKKGRKGLDFFFQLGLQVTSALEYTHSKNIIHRDIKPQNIIVGNTWDDDDQENEELIVKVLDFGIAQLTEISDSELGSKDVAGTPLYMAPETSGYTTAAVDHRSDLYALGCVLYESLAGHPPFTANTREKLAREHAQTLPEPLTQIRPEIPKFVNDIVSKLLAKDPDDRYQTAFGLQVDLQNARRCIEQDKDFFVESKELASYDKLRIMTGSLDLVGRNNEFEILSDNYGEIAKGRGRSRLTVVRGGAGTGKSRLLIEFKSYLSKHKIRYISTSFSRHENNLPFNALANGFNEYLIRVFKTQQVETDEIKRKVKTLLGPTVQLVAKVVPGLKPYIDEEDQQLDLDNHDEIDSKIDFAEFAKAFSDFTRCLTTENHPIVFIFDDMHWADQKSIELVDKFFSHNNSQRFYLIIGYRPEEIQGNLEFDKFLRKFEKLRRRYSQIELGPLEGNDISELTMQMLNTEQQLDPEFVGYLAEKTKGNPLFLVEFVRSLITKDFLFFNRNEKIWEYDLKTIKYTNILLDSIDLTLNRATQYEGADRAVLEVASILGTSFNFEMLLIDESFPSIAVLRSLQKAMTDYLIVRSTDVVDLKHLGKAFAFSHSRIRDSIRDAISPERQRQLHRKIAYKLQNLVPKPSTQMVFTFAHHFVQSLHFEQRRLVDVDMKLVMLALKYSIVAGEEAFKIGALVSAERYYRNAYGIFPALTEKETLATKKYVLNKLGDILGRRKQYTSASRFYQELLVLEPTRAEYASISYNLNYFGMLNGKVSETIKQLSKVYRRLKMEVPFWNRSVAFYLYLRIFDILVFKKSSKVFRRFTTVYSALKVRKYSREESFHPVKLYHLGQTISLNYDFKEAVAYHCEALKMCLAGYATPDAILRTLGDHAVIIGYLGFRKTAYFLLDTVLLSARELGFKQSFGYLLVQRTLTLDHLQGKFEDYKQNMNTALSNLTFEQNQQLIVQGIVFQLYQALIECDQQTIRSLMRLLPVHLRTRHWLSPRAISIYIFSLLLQDSREQIVLHRSYLRRREQVGSRKAGLYVSMIEAMINFAAGEPEKAFANYLQVLNNYHAKQSRFLYPFEEDFALLFIVFFPAVIQHEYRFFQLNLRGVKEVFQRIYERVQKDDFSRRAVPVLVVARIEELFGLKNIKSRYDASMKAGRFTRSTLVELMTHFWFGKFLLGEKQHHRREYIYHMLKASKERGLSLLEGMAVGLLEEYRFPIPETARKKSASEPTYEFSLLLTDALNLTHKVFSDRISQVQGLSSMLRLLRKSYRYDSVHIVLGDHLTHKKSRPFSSERRDPETYLKIINYVKSYFTIRSALFIPEGDAPWNKSEGEATSTSNEMMPEEDANLQNPEENIDLEMTAKLDEDDDLQSTLILEGTLPNGGDVDLGEAPRVRKRSTDSRSPGLNTIIPMKDNGTNIGVVLLEKVEIAGGDSAQARTDLDYFGAYLGLWLRYSGMAGQSSPPSRYRYESGGHYMEDCSWLHVWPEGNLRARRESTWYLGLATSEEDYLVIYCRLNGPELDRESVSSHLWFHLIGVRSLIVSKSKAGVSWEDIYEEMMKVLTNGTHVKRLEGVALSFSLFNRKKKSVISGHFGPSRPVVIGAENEIIPQNKAVMTLGHGRALRFWKVVVENGEQGVFIQTHDSSILDSLNIRSLRQSDFFRGSKEHKRKTFSIYLKQLLVEGHVPRYFVAAVFADPFAKLQALEKAE
ncbi:MAG: protein kinase [Pseudobacteriovorax sp.]|nr:protein kinase [Pseudobacteriovorax sp.]